jgi:CTD small phosphatase-like protein 2
MGGPSGGPPPDLVVEFEDVPSLGGVFFRPSARLFLEVVSKSWEVVVFTASQQAYADKVINALDPTGTTVSHRLYRQHCTELRGAYFKELGLLGRPLSQCILVDNSPISVACNADHSILIRSWYGDRSDQELPDLVAILQDLRAFGGDVSKYLSGRYGLNEFFQAMRAGAGVLQQT